MKNWIQLFFCSVIVSALSGNAIATDMKPYRICVLFWSSNIPGQVAMRKGLEAEVQNINQRSHTAGEPGIEIFAKVAGDGPLGVENQISQMNALISTKPDAIVVQPTDNAALSGPLRAANQAGIPVIAYDQYISGGKLAAYVTSDNRQAGYLGGEYLAAKFPEKSILNLILVEYPLVSSTVERLNGFLDALRDNDKKFKILKTYQAVEPISGKMAGESIVRDFPEPRSIDAIFTVNDGGGLAVVDALSKAGRNEIAIATVDGDPTSIKNIQERRLTQIDAAQFCGPIGAAAISTAYAILRGKKVPTQILVPVFPVTAETLIRYPGWQGPIPSSFIKPWKAKESIWNKNPMEVNK